MAKRHSGRGSGVLTSHAHRYTAIAVAPMALQAAIAHAGENDASMLSFSGFGSLGVARSSESTADFNRCPRQANGVGYTRDWNANADSRPAGQVGGKTSARLETHWAKLIFTGKARPPKELGGGAAIGIRVADNPDMIGHIDSAANDASVKVVLTVR